jgi:hypothetical protein
MTRALKFLIVFAAGVAALAPLPRSAVERLYSRGLYPVLQPSLTSLTNYTAVAWFDALIVVVLTSIAVMWMIRLTRRRGSTLRAIGSLTLDTAAIAGLLYLWFLAAWGLNYRREPLRTQVDYSSDRVTSDAVRRFAVRSTASLNALYDPAHAQPWLALHEVPDQLTQGLTQVEQDLAMGWRAVPGAPKRSLFNFYFTRVSIDGMTNPFLLETLVNQSLLPFEWPATIAHEWGHLAGFADESEANFIGWLVCMRGPAPVQYSSWLSLYGTIIGALHRSDRDAVTRELAEGPRQDLRAIAERIELQTNPIASRAGYALYDRYLKANRVGAGIRSYSEVVQLLVGTKFDEHGAPLLRSKS